MKTYRVQNRARQAIELLKDVQFELNRMRDCCDDREWKQDWKPLARLKAQIDEFLTESGHETPPH